MAAVEATRSQRLRISAIMIRMRIVALDTVLANAGLRNYLFVKLTTDTGLTGLGEASLEWQELAVQSLLHEWVRERIIGADPFAIDASPSMR